MQFERPYNLTILMASQHYTCRRMSILRWFAIKLTNTGYPVSIKYRSPNRRKVHFSQISIYLKIYIYINIIFKNYWITLFYSKIISKIIINPKTYNNDWECVSKRNFFCNYFKKSYASLLCLEIDTTVQKFMILKIAKLLLLYSMITQSINVQ